MHLTQPGRSCGDEENPTILLPDNIPATVAVIEEEGVYLIDDGVQIYILVQPQVAPEVLMGLFGCDNFEDFLQIYYFQPLEDNEYNSLVNNVLEEMKRLTNNFVQPRTVIVKGDENYAVIQRCLVEDAIQSYPVTAEKFMTSFNQITQ